MVPKDMNLSVTMNGTLRMHSRIMNIDKIKLAKDPHILRVWQYLDWWGLVASDS